MYAKTIFPLLNGNHPRKFCKKQAMLEKGKTNNNSVSKRSFIVNMDKTINIV